MSSDVRVENAQANTFVEAGLPCVSTSANAESEWFVWRRFGEPGSVSRRPHCITQQNGRATNGGSEVPRALVDEDVEAVDGEDYNAWLWKLVDELNSSLTDEDLAGVPTDLARNLDHYLYGAKREED